MSLDFCCCGGMALFAVLQAGGRFIFCMSISVDMRDMRRTCASFPSVSFRRGVSVLLRRPSYRSCACSRNGTPMTQRIREPTRSPFRPRPALFKCTARPLPPPLTARNFVSGGRCGIPEGPDELGRHGRAGRHRGHTPGQLQLPRGSERLRGVRLGGLHGDEINEINEVLF